MGMDITKPLRDLTEKWIAVYRALEEEAQDVLQNINRVQKLFDNASDEVIDGVAKGMIPYLKAICKEQQKRKKPALDGQVDEILRVTKAMYRRLGGGEGLATPGEMRTLEESAKASAERRLEKDRKDRAKTATTIDKNERKILLLEAKGLVKNRHK